MSTASTELAGAVMVVAMVVVGHDHALTHSQRRRMAENETAALRSVDGLGEWRPDYGGECDFSVHGDGMVLVRKLSSLPLCGCGRTPISKRVPLCGQQRTKIAERLSPSVRPCENLGTGGAPVLLTCACALHMYALRTGRAKEKVRQAKMQVMIRGRSTLKTPMLWHYNDISFKKSFQYSTIKKETENRLALALG